MINMQLINLQKRAKLSNVELSHKANVSGKTVDKWRSGDSNVPKSIIDGLEEYARLLRSYQC